MPPLLPPHFFPTSGLSCTFSQPKILNFDPFPRLSHLSASQNICVHREPGLLLSPSAARPSSTDSSHCAAPSSPWLQKRLHSLAKISPIMGTWAGRGVPEQQVPLRRGPHRGAGCGAPGRSRRRRRGEGTARGTRRSAARPPARRRRAESLPDSPLFRAR